MDILGPEALTANLDARLAQSLLRAIAGGTAEIQRNVIAERILGLPRA